MPADPRPASTVALLRDGTDGVEIFMVKRSARSAFMPHAYVFPGGRVDPEDAALPVVGGATCRSRMGAQDAAAYQVAAIRETFEESGVLLARGEPQPGDREALNQGARSFAELIGARGWVLDASPLVYFDWWITPEAEKRRYDTRFFLARTEPGALASHDERELVHSAWWPITEVLERFDRQQINLAPPTFCTLQTLSRHDAVDAALEAARARQPVAIEPVGRREDDGSLTILLPGDPEHPAPGPAPGPTRISLRKGRWFVHR